MAARPASAPIEVASPSLLDRLLACPLRVAFEQAGQRGGQQPPSSPWALVGNAIHRTIELCFCDPPMGLEEAWALACDEIAESNDDPREAPSARRSYLRLQRRLPELQAYVEDRAPASIRCEQTIASPDGRVKGRIDLLVLGSRPLVVDHKTGVVLEGGGDTSPHFRRQLAIYAWLVEAAFQIDVEDAALFSLREGLVEVDVSEVARRPFVDAALGALDAYNGKVPGLQPAAPSELVCGTCRFVGRCDAAWESLACGELERFGWGEAIRGVVTAPVVLAAGHRSAVQLEVEVGSVAGAVTVTDIPAELVDSVTVGNELALWGLALRSDGPATMSWREGSSALQCR